MLAWKELDYILITNKNLLALQKVKVNAQKVRYRTELKKILREFLQMMTESSARRIFLLQEQDYGSDPSSLGSFTFERSKAECSKDCNTAVPMLQRSIATQSVDMLH